MTGWTAQLRGWARGVKRDVIALWIAARDPRTPTAAKVAAAVVAAYALSPIDLIPDFIPLLGYLDDVVIVPLGILLVVRLVPPALMAKFREDAARREERPGSLTGTVIIIVLWVAGAALLLRWLWPRFME
ncbi:YkvA family protein [Muricoccus vinaceus]|uniref:YkvA family protein n=1 Tax=Muricoccus vinaceus TaxID=424704 RepID=A0ABV6J0T7_9PROT